MALCIPYCLATIHRIRKSVSRTERRYQQVIDKFSELLGVAPGETTEDGMFTLDALRCIGACGIAPAVSINGKVYPKVEVSGIAKIIDDLRNQA